MNDALKYSGLDVVSKLRQQSVVDKVNSVDWSQGSDSPLVVEFDPTTACNLACPDCISIKLLNQGGFERQRIREICQEFVDGGVKAVILIGGGEPLAHPDIGWVMEFLSSHDIKLGLTTNGILISRYMDIIAEQVSWCRVSMDAGTSETFRHFRPNAKGTSEFDRILENMRQLSARRKGKLGYSFLILTEFDREGRVKSSNVGEIYQAAQIAREVGCDYFEVKPSFDLQHYLIEQPGDLMALAKEQIDLALGLERDDFKIAGATNLHFTLEQLGREQPKEYSRCNVAQLRTLVTPSGMYPCPYFRGAPDKRIGDLRHQTLSDVWNGKKRLEVMDKLDPSKDCRFHCIRHSSNLELEDMIAHPPTETVPDYDPFI